MCAQGDRCVVLMTAYSAVIPTPGQGGGEVHSRGCPSPAHERSVLWEVPNLANQKASPRCNIRGLADLAFGDGWLH